MLLIFEEWVANLQLMMPENQHHIETLNLRVWKQSSDMRLGGQVEHQG